jgi:hypothetical protein
MFWKTRLRLPKGKIFFVRHWVQIGSWTYSTFCSRGFQKRKLVIGGHNRNCVKCRMCRRTQFFPLFASLSYKIAPCLKGIALYYNYGGRLEFITNLMKNFIYSIIILHHDPQHVSSITVLIFRRTIVYLQYLVSSQTVCCHTVHRSRVDS